MNIFNENGFLKSAVICSPKEFEIIVPINATQARFFSENPPVKDKMLSEFDDFAKFLSDNGTDLHYLSELPGCPYQIWTRDVAFCIGDRLFVSNMTAKLRQPERTALLDWAHEHGTKVFELKNGLIEGGDVLCNSDAVFVGISQRTNKAGIDELRHLLPSNLELTSFQLNDWVLHLDVVLNLFPGGAVFCPEGFANPSEITNLITGDIFVVSRKEAEELATNFLFLNPTTVLSQPRHKKLNTWFKNKGFEVLELDFLELNKLGGSFRCATLPIIRE